MAAMNIQTLIGRQDPSRQKLNFFISCIHGENSKDGYFDYIDINNIVKVRFHFIQLASGRYYLQTQVESEKIEKDSNVIMRLSCKESGYSTEKIFHEDLNRCDSIGKIYYSNSIGSTLIFQFSMTISAYKIKNMVQKKLYNDTEFTDFCLSTAEGTGSVAVHKALLAAHSDVFRAMLSREWKETNEGRIRMEGITLKTLQQLKDYMYLGTLPDDDLLPLWSIASCYLIEDLKARCLLKLTDIIKPENFYSMLEYSMENKMAELTFAIIKNTPEKVVLDAEKISNEKKITEETEKE